MTGRPVDDLLEPFLAEARELIDGAAEDLVALAAAPGDGARLDRVFRAFHTLKGSVGLFDFPPFLALLHAAEDGLAAARDGRAGSGDDLADLALEALDAASRFTDAIAAGGALPPGAAQEADRIAARFRGGLAPRAPSALGPAEIPDGPVPPWAEALLARAEPVAPGSPLVALLYRPREDCFFSGDDPLGLVRGVPGLLAVTVAPAGPWPADQDPFACTLAIALLSAAPRPEIDAVIRLVRDQVTAVALVAPAAPPPPDLTAAILREQLRLAAADPGEAGAGTREAAAATAANALRAAGREAAARACRFAATEGGEALAGRLAALLDAPDAPSGPQYQPDLAGGQEAAEAEAAEVGRPLRVEAARIDGLVALAGDLVAARNGLAHLAARAEAGEAAAALAPALREAEARIGRLSGDLHRGLAALRLVPLAPLFRRFARPLREIARGLGKEVVLESEGGAVGADRALVDALFEPLLHVLRNAVDHGLEPPEARRRAGKPEAGHIGLRAQIVGETLAVTVSDDGRGIYPERIRERAAALGLHPPGTLAAMRDAEVIDLVFAPGFSTAERVSDLSGRGVGMDAVRASVARLSGRVEIESAVGRGTVIRLLLPQRIALTRIMRVGIGDEEYGLPLDAVVEAARLPRERIRDLGPGAAALLRGRTVPILRLADLLGLAPAPAAPSGEALLVVLRSGPETIAVEVDRFGERLDALTRPLAGLAATPGVAGTTLLGDGRVLVVLDPPGLVAAAVGHEEDGR
ncbi:chemotaxis protein CheA [Methylobacterium sp. JK268]